MSATVFDMQTYRRVSSESREERELREEIVTELRRCRIGETRIGNAVAEGKRRLRMGTPKAAAISHAICWALGPTNSPPPKSAA
jgi:hypothetical protein